MRTWLPALAGLGLFALVACSRDAADDGAVSGDEQHITESAPIAPATWAKCWFSSNGSADQTFLAYTLTCSGPTDAAYPMTATVMVDGLDKQNGQTINGELAAGTSKGVGAVYAQRLPLALELSIIVRPTPGSGVISDVQPGEFRYHQSIDHPEQITAEKPIVITQPFALWKLTIIQKADRYMLAPDVRDAIPAAPFVTGFVDTATFAVRDDTLESAADGKPLTFIVVAPKDGHLGVRYATSSIDTHLTIDGPGTFVAEDGVLRKATDEDVVAGPSEHAPTADAGPAPTADAGPAPAPQDAGPPPTCGVPGLVCCGGDHGTCASGSYCKYNQSGPNKCEACGGPGQDCCGGNKGTCGTGAYCKYNTSGVDQCTACGGANQDCCGGNHGTCSSGLTCTYNPTATDQCK